MTVDPVAARHADIPQDTLTDPHACVDCQVHLDQPADRHETFQAGRIVGPLCWPCMQRRTL